MTDKIYNKNGGKDRNGSDETRGLTPYAPPSKPVKPAPTPPPSKPKK